MSLSVEFLDSFWDSFLLLDDSPETYEALLDLLAEAVMRPWMARPVEPTRLRVLLTAPDSGLPPLRLYYFFSEEGTQIAHVNTYDELEL